MATIHAWAAHAPKQSLVPFEYDPGELGPDEVEVAVEYCGLCHSDLSVLNNDWGNSVYPFVPGHEIIGRIVALGDQVQNLHMNQRVGIGWYSASCMHCRQCLSGNQHLCPHATATIIQHYGGFADRVRAHWTWILPIPEELDATSAGPLLCGGITVFSPFYTFNVKPTYRVGIVGIGGLGHMALKFANAWGCDVTAFTSSMNKQEEAQSFGAQHVVSSRDSEAIRKLAGSLDLLLITVNVPLDWSALISTLTPQGRMHVVGAVSEPIPIVAFDLIEAQRSVSGSPTGSPVAIEDMLTFAARHNVSPQVEHFKMSDINHAFKHLEDGNARYRIVLDADFS